MEQQMYIDWLLVNKFNFKLKLKKARSMMLLAFGFCLFPLYTDAQNLVPNPSFETFTSCPTGSGQMSKAVPWYGTNNSSEYLNSCSSTGYSVPYTFYGFQPARTGNAYSGEYFVNGYGNDYREYIQTPLTNTLVMGQCYFVRFYVNCVNSVINYACNNFAAHLSTGGYTTNFTGFPATSFTPQIYLVNNPIVKDTLKWTEIGGIYTASGGENYITIGNFKNDSNTDTLRTNNGTINAAYYFIDDVSVQQITSPIWSLRDTTIVSGDSVLIGPLYSGLTCNWFDMFGTPIGSGAGMWVKPTSTASYVLQQTFCNTTFSDTVTVNVSALGVNELNKNSKLSKLFPNPNAGEFNIEILKASKEQQVEISISEVTGKMLYNKIIESNSINLNPYLANGIYMVKVKLQDGTTDIHRLVINK